MEFSLNYTLKRFEDTETEDGKIIREGIIRGKTLVEHHADFWCGCVRKKQRTVCGRYKGQKTIIVMMTDEEYKEYIKAKRLYRVIKKGGIVMDNIKRGRNVLYTAEGGVI